jgi:hypothetical protein
MSDGMARRVIDALVGAPFRTDAILDGLRGLSIRIDALGPGRPKLVSLRLELTGEVAERVLAASHDPDPGPAFRGLDMSDKINKAPAPAATMSPDELYPTRPITPALRIPDPLAGTE